MAMWTFQNRHRAIRKKLGLCRDCQDKATPGKSRCAFCRQRQIDRWRARTKNPDPAYSPNPTKIARMLELAAVTTRRREYSL